MKALETGTTDTRVALFPVCSGLIDPRVRAAFRSAVTSGDSRIREAAIRAVCDTIDPELLPDVLKIACTAPEANFRVLATRACVRLTTQEESIKLSVKDKVEPLKAILATTPGADQKRLVLAGLGEIYDAQALSLAEPMLNDADTRLEAARAITKIAASMPYAQTAAATNALTKVLALTTDADARKAAQDALKDLEAGADYITAWQVAGPYEKEGKEYKDLFDITFPPEMSGAKGVKWKKLPPGPDTKHPWVMDLLKAIGGEQRVAYAHTWVYSEQQRPALLELGSDDGIKVWLNHQVVHTNNTFRGLQPGSDKAQVTLNPGWNDLLLKITQLNGGWAFCARFRLPDGSHMDGLKFAIQRPRPQAAVNKQ